MAVATEWSHLEQKDVAPCPKCGSHDLDFLANLVECMDCGHCGPAQKGPEFMCDWRRAIDGWNKAATLQEGNSND